MFKRVLWVSVGVALGVVAVSKANAYVKANTPDKARQFLLGPDQENVGARTLQGLVSQFKQAQQERERELNNQYINKLN
ncbi:hypothetical protein [Bifidobacterium canis]|uniref:Transporter n=1 Tax=Bifidobacterium canis TaxID=2610880 RepID=A0A7K1J3F5_9BIFI|nr:hypothetical protein [Bifidobacterium canis]MUH59049.1 hypothetical protein [Bifidobacterium canis]